MVSRILPIGFMISAILAMTGCVGPTRLGISPEQWQALDNTQRHQLVESYQKVKQTSDTQLKTVYTGPDLLVYLSQGTAMMPPFTQSYTYETVKFTITPGHCRSVVLNSIDTEKHVNLGVCYNGLTLLLDPSHYNIEQAEGTLRLDYNPVWQRGFTYSDVSSKGYVRLKNVSVTVKAIPEKVPVEDAKSTSV